MLSLLRRHDPIMNMSLLQFSLAFASIAMLSTLMFLMIKRKLRATYPLFFSFLGVNILATTILITVYHYSSGQQYFYAYWSASTVLVLVGFAVLYEVFVNILKPFSAVDRKS